MVFIATDCLASGFILFNPVEHVRYPEEMFFVICEFVSVCVRVCVLPALTYDKFDQRQRGCFALPSPAQRWEGDNTVMPLAVLVRY